MKNWLMSLHQKVLEEHKFLLETVYSIDVSSFELTQFINFKKKLIGGFVSQKGDMNWALERRLYYRRSLKKGPVRRMTLFK